jgi:hypothetical protein
MVDLQSLVVSGSSLTLLFAADINDLGEILGKGLPPDARITLRVGIDGSSIHQGLGDLIPLAGQSKVLDANSEETQCH